ncbi:MAG TPA: hypothetical protein VM425_14035 [Myxococcota bacterium]|nr:hypothetical protein [Myxococcota bacterium]
MTSAEFTPRDSQKKVHHAATLPILFCFMVVTLVTLVGIASCGINNDGITFAAPPDITGTWNGSFTDNRGSGQLLIVVSDQGHEVMPANVVGTLTMIYYGGSEEAGNLSEGSSLYKSVDQEIVVFLPVVFETAGHGANLFQGILGTDLITMSGSYGGDWSHGTFDLTKD